MKLLLRPFYVRQPSTATLFTVLALSACLDSPTRSTTAPDSPSSTVEEAGYFTAMRYLLFKEYGEEDRYRAFPIPGIRNFSMTADRYDGTDEEEGRVRQISVALKAYGGKGARRSIFWVRYVDYVLALDLLRRGGLTAEEATALGTTVTFTPATVPVIGSDINPDTLPNEDVGPWVRILTGPGAGYEDHRLQEDMWPISLLTSVQMTSSNYGDGPKQYAIREIDVRIKAVPGWGKGSVARWVHWRDWAVAYLQLRAADFEVDVGSDLPG